MSAMVEEQVIPQSDMRGQCEVNKENSQSVHEDKERKRSVKDDKENCFKMKTIRSEESAENDPYFRQDLKSSHL